MKLVTNGRLITRDASAQGYFEHGAVAFEGTKIVVTPCLMESMYSAAAVARVPSIIRWRSMAHHVPSSTS